MDKDLMKITLNKGICCYIIIVLLASLGIRIFLSILRAFEKTEKSWWDGFKFAFLGFGASDPKTNDYWQTYILGILELAVFPILLTIGRPEYIGGWLILKTLPKWKYWQRRRHVYNRFLIGNALLLIISYFIARFFVTVQTSVAAVHRLCA